jgi:hypothetical protein
MMAARHVLLGLLLVGICGILGTLARLATSSLEVIMPRHETHEPDRSFLVLVPIDHLMTRRLDDSHCSSHALVRIPVYEGAVAGGASRDVDFQSGGV